MKLFIENEELKKREKILTFHLETTNKNDIALVDNNGIFLIGIKEAALTKNKAVLMRYSEIDDKNYITESDSLYPFIEDE